MFQIHIYQLILGRYATFGNSGDFVESLVTSLRFKNVKGKIHMFLTFKPILDDHETHFFTFITISTKKHYDLD